MIPDSIKNELFNHYNLKIESEQSVSGGSINQACKILTNEGPLFLKWNPSAPDNFFEVEAKGLTLLDSADTAIRIPSVRAFQKPATDKPGYLLIEYIQKGSGSSSDSFKFGTELAKLHAKKSDFFGLSYDNFIGSLPQKNGKYKDWISFFVEKRIGLQLKMAIDSGKLSKGVLSHWKRLSNQLEARIPKAEPSLIHGDLWGGNYLFDDNGNGVLIDPAVYYGHPEMDLAFTKMFGGFSQSFYDGYESIVPLENGFDNRVPVYNMYPLLVHVNLFGGHYSSQFQRFIKNY